MAIDLRSDTYTLPTDKMRRAMAEAEVGDDVAREDPTVRALEELAAQMLGKEAALFVTSGTMGNLLGVMTHTRRARCLEAICEQRSHICTNEVAGAAVVAGVQLCTLWGEMGQMPLDSLEAAIRAEDMHHPETALICLETTHNFAGGVPLPLEYLRSVRELAKRRRLPVHIDGARLFNAAVAQGVSAREIAQYGDTVTVCLSKGLSAPVGAVFAASAETVELARRYRKMLGGGMRQAGVIAAAGIVALNEMVERLSEDHALAKKLAEGVAQMKGIRIDMRTVQTNIVIFDISELGFDALEFVRRAAEVGVLCHEIGAKEVRFVTHRHITASDVDAALLATERVIK